MSNSGSSSSSSSWTSARRTSENSRKIAAKGTSEPWSVENGRGAISGERMGTGAGRGERLFRCGVMDVAMHVQVHRKHLFQREGILDRDSYALIVISSILYKVFFLIAPIGMA